ncbi:hypothetical protein HZB60_00090 [candidate division KSB1 bacterium]|nr:hypothetical protein [candidate division KSB1 bacterium]
MKENLAVIIVGNPNSGKSHTWNTLFGAVVKTGSQLRRLCLTVTTNVEVFLVSGSPEERETYVGKIIGEKAPRIVLCSMQYRQDAVQTIQYFVEHDYFLFVHWLNPGFRDVIRYEDRLNMVSLILAEESLLGVRNGSTDSISRVQEIKDFIYGWAFSRGLVRTT